MTRSTFGSFELIPRRLYSIPALPTLLMRKMSINPDVTLTQLMQNADDLLTLKMRGFSFRFISDSIPIQLVIV